jgi:hypothetical protein
MGQSSGIITEILARVSYCEFCDKPAAGEVVCDVYTIDKFEEIDPADLSKNVIVLCQDCKKNYDTGVFGRKHLKACVMQRDPGLIEWFSNLFGQYNIHIKQSTNNEGFLRKAFSRLVNDQNFLNNTIFLFGIFLIVIGVLLFSYGFNKVSNFDSNPALITADSGNYSPEYLFYLFLELVGVVFALLGLFFDMGTVKGKGKITF